MTGRDPYCLWNDLDDQFFPVEGGGESMPPPYPSRRFGVLAAFGKFSWKDDAQMHGMKVQEVKAAS